jgi:hypothetical protein
VKRFPFLYDKIKRANFVFLLALLAGCDNLSVMDYINTNDGTTDPGGGGPGASGGVCEITDFVLDEAETLTIGQSVITVMVPAGTVVTSLAPVVGVSPGAALKPPSGTAQNFSGPVLYTVTAADGVTARTYTVTLRFAPAAARIETVQYNTLQDAVAAAPEGGVVTLITLLRDVTLNSALTINNKTIGIVSAAPGHTITRGAKVAGSLVLISGGGSLTLGDGAAALTFDGGAVWAGGVTGNPGPKSLKGGGPLITVEGGGSLKTRSGVILQNNHNTAHGGGGVIVSGGGDFTMDGGHIKANAASGTGGGAAVSGGGSFSMNGGFIGGNAASGEGGGVAFMTGGDFTMSGGVLSGNRASGAGNGVFASSGGGDFTMSGGAEVNTNNDVYLGSGKHIHIGSALTANPAAQITPSAYVKGLKALDGALSGNYSKFTITPDVSNPWHIDSSGYLEPGP